MADLKTDLAEVLARIDERTDGDYLARLANGTNIALESANFLHDHGDELLAAVENAERYRWLRENWSRLCTSTGCTASEVVVTELFVAGDSHPVAPWSLDDAIDRVVAGNGGGD